MTDDRASRGPLAPAASADDAHPADAAGSAAGRSIGSTPNEPTTALVAGATAAWSRLDETTQLVGGGSIGVIVITLLGLLFGAWGSADFVLLMLVAAVITAGTAWAASSLPAQPRPIPLPVVELAAASVTGVLAIWNLIEIVFDADHLEKRGGIVGLILTVALAVAGAAVLAGTLRRVTNIRAVILEADTGGRIAAVGLAMVLLGWALNLSVGLWTISGAALSLAVLTLATVIILFAREIESPFPVAWIGVVLGVFAAFLAFGQWDDLAYLGANKTDLSITDLLAFGIYVVGLVLVIAGGVVSAVRPDQPAATPVEPPTAHA
jgi:hypothetical protein